MMDHFIVAFMSFSISVVPVINFLQLQHIISYLNKGTNNNIEKK